MTDEMGRRGRALSRRHLMVAGVAGLTAGCSLDISGIRLDQDGSAPPRRTPDDDAREACVLGVHQLLVGNRALAAKPGSPAAVSSAARAAVPAYQTQLSGLGPLPVGANATPTAVPTTPARLVLSGRTLAAEALSDVTLTSGPLARLLACVAGGVLVRTTLLATAAKLAAGPTPRAAAAVGLPALDNDDLLGRLRDTTADPILPEPPGEPALAALRALSTTLRRAEYGYGLASARLAGTERSLALVSSGVHRRAALGLDAVAGTATLALPPAAASYPVAPVSSAVAARVLARRLELECAHAASRAVAELSTTFPLARCLVADHVVTSALGAGRWNAAPALPGMTAP